MPTIPERIQAALDHKGVSWSKAATSIGLSAQAATKWKKGQIGKETLEDLAKFLGVSYAWLATGEGHMHQITPEKINGYSKVEDWDSSTPLGKDEVEIPYYKDLAFACGHGRDCVAYDDEWRRLRFSRMTLNKLGVYKDKTFAATTNDDSMLPTIQDGDTIFVDENRTRIKDGKIFAIEHGGLFYCKRLYNLPNGGVRVVSDNSDEFPEYTLTREQMTDFRVIGWVYSISRLERW